VFFYLYLYPKLAIPVYKHHLAKQTELQALKQEAEGGKLLSLKDSRELRAKLAKVELKYDEEAAECQEQVKVLTESLNDEIEEHMKEVESLSASLSEAEKITNQSYKFVRIQTECQISMILI